MKYLRFYKGADKNATLQLKSTGAGDYHAGYHDKRSYSEPNGDVHIHETILVISKLTAVMASESKRSKDAASTRSGDRAVEHIIDFTSECRDSRRSGSDRLSRRQRKINE